MFRSRKRMRGSAMQARLRLKTLLHLRPGQPRHRVHPDLLLRHLLAQECRPQEELS
jgi:hypothetical protein